MHSIAVATAAVGSDQEPVRPAIERTAHFVPPAANALHRKLGSVVIDAHTHPALIGCKIVDAV
jgi:hypothetical protein